MLLSLDTEALWSYRGSREYKENSRPCRPVVLQTNHLGGLDDTQIAPHPVFLIEIGLR